MKLKLLLSLLLFSSILLADQISDDPNMGAEVISIKSDSVILEEWKNPGRYSPVKAFDGKTDTCAAEGAGDNWLGVEIKFSKEIYIDEIRIMNGFGKSEELFMKNNRAGKFSIYIYKQKKLLKKEIVVLKDQREFQSLKFNDDYKTNWIGFAAWGGGVYKGTTYDDTCITEIELYYKGKKFEINNADQLQKDYLKKLGTTLIKAFTDREYSEAQAGYSNIYFHKDGTVSFSDEGTCEKDEVFKCISKFVPYFWKIENLKLYMRNSKDEKWKLTKYNFLYDYDGENYFVRALTIYKDPVNDSFGFSMRDVIEDEKAAAEMEKREEQQKKKAK